jgi:hypothetical protein
MDADGRPGRVFNAARAMQPNGRNRLADTAPPNTGRRSFGEDMPAIRTGMRIADFMPAPLLRLWDSDAAGYGTSIARSARMSP